MEALRTGSNHYHIKLCCLIFFPDMEAFEVDQIIITAIFLLKNFSRNGSPSMGQFVPAMRQKALRALCLKNFPEMEALRWDNLFQQCDKKR